MEYRIKLWAQVDAVTYDMEGQHRDPIHNNAAVAYVNNTGEVLKTVLPVIEGLYDAIFTHQENISLTAMLKNK